MASSSPAPVEPLVSDTSVAMPLSTKAKVDKTHSSPIQLDLAALSRRVGLSYQKISARRRRSDFIDWISDNDPDGYGWEYSKDRKTFFMVTAA